MAIIQGAIIQRVIFLGSNYSRGQLSGGVFPGGQLSTGQSSRGKLSGGQFSLEAIVRTPFWKFLWYSSIVIKYKQYKNFIYDKINVLKIHCFFFNVSNSSQFQYSKTVLMNWDSYMIQKCVGFVTFSIPYSFYSNLCCLC